MNETIYLEKLSELRSNFSVKLITGLRGCGKTTLLKKFAEQLKSDGMSEDEIIFLDFEQPNHLTNFEQLYSYVSERTANLENACLILDEVQHVKDWEKAVNALFLGAPIEIYAISSAETDSVKKLQSLLPDNCDVLKIYPMSFADCLNQNFETENFSASKIFDRYVLFGGLPAVNKLNNDEETSRQILRGTFYEILFRDLVEEYSARNPSRLFRVLEFLAENISEPLKLRDLQNYLAVADATATASSTANYLNIVLESGFFRKIPRYDFKKDSFLSGADRFYCVDTGLCNALLSFGWFNETALVRNLVYNELVRRGYEVCCAKVGTMTIDFFAADGGDGIFIQVLPTDGKTSAGQLARPLHKLPNDVNKIIISKNPVKIKGGVKNIAATDFLLKR